MLPPNSETACGLEQVTPDGKLLTYLPCVGRHTTRSKDWVSPDPAKAMREPRQGGHKWQTPVLWISLCAMVGPNVAAMSDTYPVRDHKLWGFPCT